MSNHTAVKVGGWVFRDPIAPAEITGIQERLLKCPNFDEGSTHAPSGDIILTDGGVAARKVAMRTSGELGSSAGHAWTQAGTLSIGGVISFLTSGRMRPVTLKTSLSGDINFTYDGQHLWVIDGLGGTDRAITLLNSGCATGDFIFVLNRDASNTLNIVGETTGLQAIVHSNALGLAVFSVDRWYPVGAIT